ncbi:MAG: tetratricopeptide repeat protein [Prolixibacteraceae bacterium]|nr:tetratricopeptide repeat protein [Prolixibacteraceae bacterium]
MKNFIFPIRFFLFLFQYILFNRFEVYANNVNLDSLNNKCISIANGNINEADNIHNTFQGYINIVVTENKSFQLMNGIMLYAFAAEKYDKNDSILLNYFQEVGQQLENEKNSELQAALLSGIGYFYRLIGDATKSILHYEKALQKTHNDSLLLSIFLNISNLYLENSDYDNSIRFCKKALDIEMNKNGKYYNLD